jgi:hypothetical protein
MTADLGLDLTIVPVATFREPDGLALSSRNVHLAGERREAATVLSRALAAARSAYLAGEHDASALRAVMEAVLAAEPLARVDYISVADDVTLQELDRVEGPAVASLAVAIGPTRLIDNVRLATDAPDPFVGTAGTYEWNDSTLPLTASVAKNPAGMDGRGRTVPVRLQADSLWLTIRALDGTEEGTVKWLRIERP